MQDASNEDQSHNDSVAQDAAQQAVPSAQARDSSDSSASSASDSAHASSDNAAGGNAVDDVQWVDLDDGSDPAPGAGDESQGSDAPGGNRSSNQADGHGDGADGGGGAGQQIGGAVGEQRLLRLAPAAGVEQQDKVREQQEEQQGGPNHAKSPSDAYQADDDWVENG